MKLKRHIPNFITSLNLVCGCLSIVAAFNHQLAWSAYFIGMAAILDFLDGMIARLLNVSSEIGKQLDSLADVISFGLAPGIILFQMITVGFAADYIPWGERGWHVLILSSAAFLIPVFSAIRLAKFNIDLRQTDSFIGLPTPANAIFIASLDLILEIQLYKLDIAVASLLYNPYVLIGIGGLMSALLVCELPLFSLKFKNIKWKGNQIRYIFILLSLCLLIYFEFLGIPMAIFLYLLLSMINNFIYKKSITH